ncbi:MAG: hypothetical protein ACFFA4_08250 [Promethearchaeota archaeon]
MYKILKTRIGYKGEFKKSKNKIPQTSDKEMNGTRKALYRGEWSEYVIKT